MKSPWNIIGRLIAGRRPVEETSTPVSNDGTPSNNQQGVTEHKATSPRPDNQLANSGAAQRANAIDDQPNDAAVSSLVRAQKPAAPAPDLSASSKSADPADKLMYGGPSTQLEKRRQTQRQRRTSPSTAPEVKAIGDDVSISQAGGEERTLGFATDIIAVEADVRALRRRLAEKLVEQNAQLRQMLERFGNS